MTRLTKDKELTKKFRRIQRLNSKVFRLVHELSEEEWELFKDSYYVEPVYYESNVPRTMEEKKE